MRLDGRPAGAGRLDDDVGGGVRGIMAISGARERGASESGSMRLGGVEGLGGSGAGSLPRHDEGLAFVVGSPLEDGR
jgi:hypothetical protein